MPNTHTTHIYTNTWCWSQVFRAYMATVYGRDSILIISLLKHYLEQFALYENHRWVIMKLAGICINLVVITTCRHVLQLSNQSNPVFFPHKDPECIDLNTFSIQIAYPPGSLIFCLSMYRLSLCSDNILCYFLFFSLYVAQAKFHISRHPLSPNAHTGLESSPQAYQEGPAYCELFFIKSPAALAVTTYIPLTF